MIRPRLGALLSQVPTPSLLLTLPALEANEAAMRGVLRATGVALRPHGKMHKSSSFARWLLRRGGAEMSGVCAQTLRECVVMVRDGGATDVLLTNLVVGPGPAATLASLAADHPAATIGVLVDSQRNVVELAAAATGRSATLRALVEFDAG